MYELPANLPHGTFSFVNVSVNLLGVSFLHVDLGDRMTQRLKVALHLAMFFVVAAALSACSQFTGDNRDQVPLTKAAIQSLADIGSSPQQAMMVRIYKQSSELEVWKRTTGGPFVLFKTYPICNWSGAIGPKFKEGDMQAPEGFYTVTPAMMNPKSALWLSFNTGFPNKFDQAWGRTGTNLMVHGDCRSVGCYAMTDESIKEIYALARESFAGGNRNFQLELFPFRMTAANLAANAASQHSPFWANLREGSDLFESTRQPPVWDVCEKKYVFNRNDPAKQPLDPLGACPVAVAGAVVAAQ